MKVPLKVRMAAASLCRRGLGRSLGVGDYWKVAEITARRLTALPGVLSVSLRGGMTTHCRPAISDLDFTVVIEGGTFSEEVGQSRRVLGTYRKLASVLPILGELTLTTRERWSLFKSIRPGPILWYGRQLEFRDGDWGPLTTTGEPHDLSRFALAFDHFHLAIKALHLREQSYGRMLFEKEMSKCLRYSLAQPQQGSPIELAIHGFRELDRLAVQALAVPLPGISAELPRASQDSRNPTHAVLSDWIISGLNQKLGGRATLRTGPAPFTVIADASQSDLWMDKLLKRNSRKHSFPILPLSTAMAECQRSGWGGWWTLETLRWFPYDESSSEDAPKASLLRSLVERLCHDSVSLLPGKAALVGVNERQIWLSRVRAETSALGTSLGLITDEPVVSNEDATQELVAVARRAFSAVSMAETQWKMGIQRGAI